MTTIELENAIMDTAIIIQEVKDAKSEHQETAQARCTLICALELTAKYLKAGDYSRFNGGQINPGKDHSGGPLRLPDSDAIIGIVSRSKETACQLAKAKAMLKNEGITEELLNFD